jgi:hypothetical protein
MKHSWNIYDPDISPIRGEKIPLAAADAALHYLGGTFSPWKGLGVEGLCSNFEGTLERVQKLNLKQHQKTTMITTYIIPHYLYALVLAMVPMTTIQRMDQDLRRVI